MAPEHDCRKEGQLASHEERLVTLFNHVKEGGAWRIAILGIVFTLVVNIVTFARLWGQLTTQVTYDRKDLDKITEWVDAYNKMLMRNASIKHEDLDPLR